MIFDKSLVKHMDIAENKGHFFNNPAATDNEKAPVLIGQCNIGGIMYGIAAWISVSGKGEEYYNLTFQEIGPAQAMPKQAIKPLPRLQKKDG